MDGSEEFRKQTEQARIPDAGDEIPLPAESTPAEEKLTPDEKQAVIKKLKLAGKILAAAAVVAVLFKLFQYVYVQLLEVCGPLFAEGAFPLFDILWSAVKSVGVLLLPFLLPVAAILGIWLAVSAVHQLSMETRRFGKQSAGGVCSIIADSLQKNLFALVSHLPTIIAVLVVVIGLNTLLVGINSFRSVVNNMKRIKELTVILKNLSRAEDLARVSMLYKTPGYDDTPMKTYKIEVLSERGETVSEQIFTLKGKEIALDFITVNFEYSEIEDGKNMNLAYPYRVYTEKMKPEEGVPLKCVFNEERIPVMYCLDDRDIYGIEKDTFFNRLKELFDIIQDENLSRDMGIRSVNGVVPHFAMEEGETYRISVEATGGLSVHKENRIDND